MTKKIEDSNRRQIENLKYELKEEMKQIIENNKAMTKWIEENR